MKKSNNTALLKTKMTNRLHLAPRGEKELPFDTRGLKNGFGVPLGVSRWVFHIYICSAYQHISYKTLRENRKHLRTTGCKIAEHSAMHGAKHFPGDIVTKQTG